MRLRLAAAGFDASYIARSRGPRLLPGDVMGRLVTFSGCFTAVLPEKDRAGISNAFATASAKPLR